MRISGSFKMRVLLLRNVHIQQGVGQESESVRTTLFLASSQKLSGETSSNACTCQVHV